MPTLRRVTLQCDEHTLVPLEQLDGRGIAVTTITLTDPVTGEHRAVTIPQVQPCACCGQCHARRR